MTVENQSRPAAKPESPNDNGKENDVIKKDDSGSDLAELVRKWAKAEHSQPCLDPNYPTFNVFRKDGTFGPEPREPCPKCELSLKLKAVAKA